MKAFKIKYFCIGLTIGILTNLVPSHSHMWKEESRTFNPPRENFTCAGVCGDELYWGVTIIRYRCQIDGKEKIVREIGEVQ